MLYYEKEFTYEKYSSKVFDRYFGPASFCVLDIETTGLSPDRSQFVLGSLLSFTKSGARMQQYFAEDLSEERTLMAAYLEELRKYNVLLTYNGKHFDIPFLLSRAEKLDLRAPYMPYNLDLYLVLDKFSSLRKLLPNLKQKTVENFMGLWHLRADEISGGESVRLYYDYLACRQNNEDAELPLSAMLLHNSDDVLQLGRLLPILEKVDLHRAMYSLGFPAFLSALPHPLSVERILIDKNALTISGRQLYAPFDYISFGNSMNDIAIHFGRFDASFAISIPVFRRENMVICDLTKLPFGAYAEFKHTENVASGYFILQNGNDIHHMEINRLIQLFLEDLMNEISGETIK